MTRVNIIPPSALTDQHLIAEARELNLLAASFKRSANSKHGIQLKRIPKQYTLNKGHVLFFYDKGLYIKKRFDELVLEMEKRKFVKAVPFKNEWNNPKFNKLYNDWTPTQGDYRVVIERIKIRINQKPTFYRYKGVKIKPDDYFKNFLDVLI